MFGAAWTRSGAFSLMSNGGQVSDSMPVPMSMHNGDTPGARPMIVGLFTDMANLQHGYVLRDGMLEPYDATSVPPDPTKVPPLTAIWDINPGRQFVGTYRETGEPMTKRHGFVQNPDEPKPITLDFTCQDPAGCAGVPLGYGGLRHDRLRSEPRRRHRRSVLADKRRHSTRVHRHAAREVTDRRSNDPGGLRWIVGSFGVDYVVLSVFKKATLLTVMSQPCSTK